MARDMILITGYSATGTSFMAGLFKKLGFDCGNISGIDRRGNEWGPFYAVTRDMEGAVFGKTQFEFSKILEQLPQKRAEVLDYYKREIKRRQIHEQMPEVVKSPLAGAWLEEWIEAGGRVPEYVVVCTRNPYKILEDTLSVRGNRTRYGDADGTVPISAMAVFGKTVEFLARSRILYVVLNFPGDMEDAERLYAILGGILGCSEDDVISAHKSLWKGGFVRFG